MSLLREAMLSRWKSYRHQLDECRNKPTAESVHELRVSIRRLISQLLLNNQILPRESSDKARNILKRQLESLGDLRDTHVRQIFFQEQVAKYPELAELLARLQRRERSLVRRASGKINRFKTKKLEKWVGNISQLIGRHSNGAPQEMTVMAFQSANAAFADVVERWRLIDPSDLRTVHRTRVAFKKFRYLVESLPPELTGFRKRDLRKLARCQRAMGNIQDLEVIQAFVLSFMKRHEDVRLDLFCGYLKGRRARAVRSFLKKSAGLPHLWPPGEPLQTQTSVMA